MKNTLVQKSAAVALQGRLPNLVIIGAMKCGTSSLHRYLDLHPQIQMSNDKELDFFIEEKNWIKGEAWYRSHFKSEADVVGESSPNYTKYPFFSGVPEKMHTMIPNAKLIYIVRDPIKRIASHYLHQYTDRVERRTLEEALSTQIHNHYLETTRYGFQLRQYLRYYSRENILLLSLEDMQKHRLSVLKRVFEFLDVDPSFQHPQFSEVFHQSNQKRRLTIFGALMLKIPFGGRLISVLSSVMSESVAKPCVNAVTQRRIMSYLAEDWQQTQALLSADKEVSLRERSI